MKICEYEECDKKHYAKGYCAGHYGQLREGRPLSPLRKVRGGPRVAASFRDAEGRKRCSTCREWLPEQSFGLNAAASDGLANSCRDCQWSNGLWSKYRITGDRYRELLARQEHCCRICGSKPDARLAVDHDHSCCPGDRSCGACVRGLLCTDCNTAIGSLKDDVDLLKRAIAYLEESRAS